jgi:hypothetical protein
VTNPLSGSDRIDPGDEVFRRFRFQASYAAMLAIGLLDPDGETSEIYCEQHEDILLRLVSGKFRGLQIKTREDGGASLKSTDGPVLDSLVRFVELEIAFPGSFEGYLLASNVAFDRAGKGHGNLHSVLAEVRAPSANLDCCPKAAGLAKTVAARLNAKSAPRKPSKKKPNGEVDKTEASAAEAPSVEAKHGVQVRRVTTSDVFSVLAKLDVQDDLPRLPDLGSRMLDRLVQCSPKVVASPVHVVRRVVEALQFIAYLASSRGDEDMNGRRWFVSDPNTRAERLESDEISAKCLSRATVESAIDRHCVDNLLVSAAPVTPDQIPSDLDVLEKKLVAGGLSLGTLLVARDAVASVEEFGIRMCYLHDPVEGLRRYNHVRTIVKKECTFSYEAQLAAGRLTGPSMLADIEQRLRGRRAADRTGLLNECEEEHLLGHAFALTGECVVWWSELRNLGSGSSAVAPDEPSDD